MSLLSPENADEVRQSGWFFLPLLLAPMVAPVLLWWRLYITFDAVVRTFPFAIAGGLLLAWLVARRSARMIRMGLHPLFPPAQGLPAANVCALFALMPLYAWCWSLLLLSAGVAASTPTQDRMFTVSAVKECTRKCSGCSTRAELAGWVGATGALFCVDDLAPRPRVGERIAVRGKFHELVQYIEPPVRR